jgi:hypothetical protein
MRFLATWRWASARFVRPGRRGPLGRLDPRGQLEQLRLQGNVTLARLGAWSLPGGQEAETYGVEWLYESGHKDTGIGVRLGERLYVAWSPTPLVELYVAMPAPDSLAPRSFRCARPAQDRVAYGFRRDGLGKLLTLGGPTGSPKGDYAFGGIALAPDGTRRGTTTTEGVLAIEARPAGSCSPARARITCPRRTRSRWKARAWR